MTATQKSQLNACLRNLARDKGDTETWKQMYLLLWPRVLSTSYRALGGLRDRADDAAQEVFYRLVSYGDFARARTPDEFLGYLNVICENVAADFLKELAEATIALEEGLEDRQQEPLSPPNPEQLAISEDLLRKLRSSLDAEEQKLLDLVQEGYKDGEIAQQFGWSYGKAAIKVHRLRAKARKLMITNGL